MGFASPLSANRQGEEKLLITDGKQYLMPYFPAKISPLDYPFA